MSADLRYHVWDENAAWRTYARPALMRYRFEFVGVQPLPLPEFVYRESRLAEGTVELYGAERYLVESIDEKADPPVAILRKVRT
jgi:hypothetical protein